MIILRKILLTAFIFLIGFPLIAAADVSVSLKLDRNRATTMDSVRMVVEVSGVRDIDTRPEIRGLDAFDVVQGGTSSRVEFVNGNMSARIEFSYMLQPLKTGDFVIGPAFLEIKGRTLESNKETLTITEPARSTGESRGPVFLSAGISSEEAYVEEQVIYTLRLYRQVDVSDISLRLPEAENLDFRQLGKPVEYQGIYNGRPYQILEVRYALTAGKEGVYGIRPARMKLLVKPAAKRSPFGLFDDPFFSSMNGEPKTIASEPIELKVLPVPVENRHPDYCGLVGEFGFESRLEPVEVKAGESSTLTVVLKGRGNIKLIPDLKIPDLKDIKIYPDQPVLEEGMDSEGVTGSKTMKWALVPEREGEYEIPGLSVTFFDIVRKEFRNINSSPCILKVLPGEEASAVVNQKISKEGAPADSRKKKIEEVGRDILPIHSLTRDFQSGRGIGPGGFLPWMVLVFPVFIYGIALFYIKFSRRSEEKNRVLRTRKAADRLLRTSRRAGITPNEMIQAVQTYINDRFGLSIGSITASDVLEILTARKAGPETVREWNSLVKRFEDAVYTGRGAEGLEVYHELKDLVKKLEKEIR